MAYGTFLQENKATSNASLHQTKINPLSLQQMKINPLSLQQTKINLLSSQQTKINPSLVRIFFNIFSFFFLFHSSCSQCTNNSWACDWCLYDNQCVHDSKNLCQPGVVYSLAVSVDKQLYALKFYEIVFLE